MAAKTFDALTPELQKIVLQAAKEATVYERVQEQAAGKAAEDDMEKKGVKFNAIDKAPFQAATKPVIDAYAKSINMTEMLAAFQAAK